MIKLRHETLIIISGLVWFAVGVLLLTIGIRFILSGINPTDVLEIPSLPILSRLGPYLGGMEQAALVLVALALFIGNLKGKHVLGKSANKGIARIRSFSNPTSLSNIYSSKYYILLAVMIGLGLSMKFLGFPADIRGFIDIAVGAALISGSMIYFRNAAMSPAKEKR